MYKYFLLIWLIACCCLNALAQKPDTAAALKSKKDTLSKKTKDTVAARPFIPKRKKEKVFIPDSTHSPRKAILRSLIIPGWGQVYNHHWWKVPVIYGTLGTLGYIFVFNNTYYQEFLALSIYREHGIVPAPGQKYYADYQLYINVPDQGIYDANDFYRRDRDLSFLGFFAAWGINCIEAYIDAKFESSYSIDNNFSFKIKPDFINQTLFAQNLNGSLIPALKITFTIK